MNPQYKNLPVTSTPEQAANQQKAQQALDNYFATHKYTGHTYHSTPKVEILQIQRVPSPAERREHVMNRDIKLAGIIVTLVAIGLIAWQSYRLYFGRKADAVVVNDTLKSSTAEVSSAPLVLPTASQLFSTVPTPPTVDNDHVAPGCEQFSSMPPAKPRAHIPPPPV